MPSAFILAVRDYPALPRAGQLAHQRYVPTNPLVLGRKPLKSPAPTTDRDRPVSRRSKPSSRTAFIGEQPNPWDLLQPQDAMSRHRGAKPPRRCERSASVLRAIGPADHGHGHFCHARHVAMKFRLYHHPTFVGWDAWRAVVEGSWLAPEDFPADCPRRALFHLDRKIEVASDTTPLHRRDSGPRRSGDGFSSK